MQSYPIPSVRAIIENDKKQILLLKRAVSDNYGGKWCLPGGKIDLGQKAVDAIIREIKEETDLDCLETEFLFYMDGLPSGKMKSHNIIFYFACRVKGEIRLNEESDEYRWVNINDLDEYEIVFGNDTAVRKQFNEKEKS